MSQPLLTIAMPVKDRADIVGCTLNSLRAQVYRPLNIVLVDNGSSDGSMQVLQQWKDEWNAPDFKITILSEPMPGAAAARNKALEAVDTEWVMFFDSDDMMHPLHVQIAMAAFKEHPSAQIIGWDVYLHLLDSKKAVKPFAVKSPIYNCIINGTMATLRYMVRTELVKQVGNWNPSVMVWNDIELGVRLLQATQPQNVVKVEQPFPTVDVYCSADSITGSDFASKCNERLHSLDCIEQAASSKSTKRTVNLRRAILAANIRREGHPSTASKLLKEALAKADGWHYKLLLRLAYSYTRLGLRGIGRILKPFYC